MTSHDLRPDDRETLSALFDGELTGEARLFALRRLGHDDAWQAHCGRWQVIGDAMRRAAPIAAPSGFAGRVAAAVAGERAPVAAPLAPAARVRGGSRLRWFGGGAIAASIALAVVVSSLPTDRSPQAAAPVVASAAPGATPQPVAPSGTAPRPSAPVEVASNAARTVVAAVPPPAVADAAPRRPPASVAGARSRATAAAVSEANVAVPVATGAALLAGQSGNPFNLSGDEALTARPWPRASIATSPAAFTARFGDVGDSAGERPSFYPFEPRPQGEAEQAPTP